MPRSVIIYSSRDRFTELAAEIRETFMGEPVKPFTISFPQKTGVGIRGRITELADTGITSIVERYARGSEMVLASAADRDVRRISYERMIEEADRSARIAAVQLVSPTMIEVLGQTTPFPVASAMLSRYGELWTRLSGLEAPTGETIARHVSTVDFKISRFSSPFGIGAQGWVVLEIAKGRTEEEIRLFNALIDFAFYAGTGIHTDDGLGQTRRLDRAQR